MEVQSSEESHFIILMETLYVFMPDLKSEWLNEDYVITLKALLSSFTEHLIFSLILHCLS